MVNIKTNEWKKEAKRKQQQNKNISFYKIQHYNEFFTFATKFSLKSIVYLQKCKLQQ